MTRQTTISGAGLALAGGAACLFMAWALMPDAGTNDAAHILAVVAGARARVRASTVIPHAGAALLVPGLLSGPAARVPAVGRVVMLWGALGMAADAVFHQLAYQMTAGPVTTEAVALMARMQTAELAPHVPFLLAFLIGPPLLGWQLRRHEGPNGASWLLLAAAPTVPACIAAVRLAGLPKHAAAMVVLAVITAGLMAVGLATSRERRA